MTQLDGLHLLLITGFVGFVSGLASHVITKWRLSGRYITREEFVVLMEAENQRHTSAMDKLIQMCQFNQANCPIKGMQRDIIEVKAIQSRRTSDLEAIMRQTNRRHAAELNVWRAILESLDKNVHEQNEILGDLLDVH